MLVVVRGWDRDVQPYLQDLRIGLAGVIKTVGECPDTLLRPVQHPSFLRLCDKTYFQVFDIRLPAETWVRSLEKRDAATVCKSLAVYG